MFRKLVLFRTFLLFLIPLILTACENSTENNSQNNNAGIFPNKVGDKWIYSVHDSLNNSEDTLTIEIVGSTIVDNENLTIWVLRSNLYNDSLFVSVDKEAVNFYEDRNINFVDHKIVLPLVVGNYWYNPGQQFDSTIVKNKEPVSVPAGNYYDAFRLERKWGGFNVYGYSITWFVDNVGTVKMYRRIQGFDNIEETWELLSYTVQ